MFRSYVRAFLAGIVLQRYEEMSETGLEHLPAIVDRANREGEIRFLFVGRIIRTKGARDVIRALAIARELPAILDIVGDGFDRTACENLVTQLGLHDRIRFHGWLPRDEVKRFYESADVFVFPSYREPGGNVMFEAMGYGLPLIVADVGGPGVAVDEKSGIRLHPTSPDQYAHSIAAAMRRLATDHSLRLSLGVGARRRVCEIGLWDGKVRNLEGLFREILGASQVSSESAGSDLGFRS